jgi:hypothetical protein
MDAPLLIYIMGDGRSGSTVLAALLGNHPGVVALGEINKWPYFRGETKNGDEKEGLAEFWGAVLSAYRDQHTDTPFSRLVEVQCRFEDYRQLPSVILGLTPRWAREIYHNHTFKLVTAVNRVTGESVFVDSSKRMGRAFMLLRNPCLDVKVIHIVRDPRGALWSQMKRDVEQKSKKPLPALCHYWIKNLFCHLVAWFSPRDRVLRLRYEDVVTQTEDVIDTLEGFLGLSLQPLRESVAANNPLVVENLLDGNRLRRQRELRLKVDDAWRSGLSRIWKSAALLLTMPFSAVYGYWFSNPRNRGEA